MSIPDFPVRRVISIPTHPRGILALDIDGTLTGPGGEIGEWTREAVRAAGEADWLVTLATGRSWAGTQTVAEQLGLEVPVICYNGALVRDSVTGAILQYRPLLPAITRSVVTMLAEIKLQPLVVEDIRRGERLLTGPTAYDGELSGVWLERLMSVHHLRVERLNYTDLANSGHSVRIMFYDALDHLTTVEAFTKVQERDFRLLVTATHDQEAALVEFLHPRSTKAAALGQLAEEFGLTMANIIAVGDGVNDLEMLAEAGLGVAMGNASEDVQSVADIIIGHHLDEGLAHFIEEHLLSGRKVGRL